MKKIKGIISVILVLTLLAVTAAPASAAEVPATKLPTVYVHGQGRPIFAKDENGQEQQVYPFELDAEGLVKQLWDELGGPFWKGFFTGNWNSWCDKTIEIIGPVLNPIALDENGNASNGTYVHTHYAWNTKNAQGTYNFSSLDFNYDWRVDPCESADKLAQFINEVIRVTDASVTKVNLVGRCIGSNVVLAYLAKYGTEKINNLILYCTSFTGMELVGRAFTGQIEPDGRATARFIQNYLTDPEYADEEAYALLVDLVDLLSNTGMLGIALWFLKSVYGKVYENFVPRLLLESFGTMPAFWSLVGDDYYEDAKKFVFGSDPEKYAGMIEKLDNYHYNILDKTEEILTSVKDSGVNVYIAAKYGLQIVPLCENNHQQSDYCLELTSGSYGATCTDMDETFSSKYHEEAKKNGTEKYISIDNQIDASTCFLPDHTWFIKDCSHLIMPDIMDYLFAELLDSEEYMTVFDDPNYPQYLCYSKADDTLLPLTEENCDTLTEWKISPIKHFFNLIKGLFNMLKSL